MKVDVAQVISEGVAMVGTIATYEGHAALSASQSSFCPIVVLVSSHMVDTCLAEPGLG